MLNAETVNVGEFTDGSSVTTVEQQCEAFQIKIVKKEEAEGEYEIILRLLWLLCLIFQL